MRSILVSLIALALAPRLSAQTLVLRTAEPRDSVPLTVAAAETEGVRWPRAARNNGRAPGANDAWIRPSLEPGITIGGTVERKCVDADRLNIIRSGDFVAGPFQLYSEIWADGYGKLWWEPSVLSTRDTFPLTVRVTRLDAPGTAAVYLQPSLAYAVDQFKHRTSNSFYPSGIHVATAGRWMFVATAGPNWGCYMLTVAAPKRSLPGVRRQSPNSVVDR